MLSYSVRLIAVSGREQPVVLKIRRDGLWLYTEHGKEIQQLPYQHIVKWLPSKMRSRDPGPDDCLDIQVETASGKKDLRMRCQSEPTVQSIIADIRNTVQAIMSELDPAKPQASPPKQRPGAEPAGHKQQPTSAALPRSASPQRPSAPPPQQQLQRLNSPSRIPGLPPARAALPTQDGPQRALSPPRMASPGRSRQQPQQQQQQQQHLLHQQQEPLEQLESYEQDLHQQQRRQQQQQQQQSNGRGGSPSRSQSRNVHQLMGALMTEEPWGASTDVSPQPSPAGRNMPAAGLAGFASPLNHYAKPAVQRQLPAVGPRSRLQDILDLEQEQQQGSSAPRRVDQGTLVAGAAPMRRSTGELGEFAGEAAAQIQLLEDMVRRLSEELAGRVASEPAAVAAGAGALGSHAAQTALPPWMKDSRYLNPLLSAYDQRLSAAMAELTAKTEAVRDVQDKVQALVAENESLHERIAKQAAQLEAKSANTAAAVAATDADKARLQERLDLLEQENDLLVSQQGALDAELTRLSALMQQKDQELAEARGSAAASTALRSQLEQAVKESNKAASDNQHLKNKVKSLSERLSAENAKTADAIAAAEGLRQQQHLLQQELAAAQATTRTVPGLQAELSSVRSAADQSAAEADRLRSECEGLRGALHAVEQRLVEYQEKDTEVYLRIKEAMELAEEARLERDAARTETDSLQVQLAATQAKLQEATRQLSGGGVDGPSYKQLKKQSAAAQEQLAAAAAKEEQLTTQVSELRLSADRLARDKSSLASELQAVKDELEVNSFMGKRADLAERLDDAERGRDDALQKLDTAKRAAARAEREWELERQQMQGDIQRLIKKAAGAEEATSAAQAAAAEAQQAVAAIEGELNALKAARARGEGELKQQLTELRSERDAEVAALVQKLERALATCDKSVVDAEQMLAAKDSLLRRWKQEAQLIASKLEVALQQHQAELAERQAQVAALTQQLAAAHEQQELLQQELDATRLSCREAEMLLGEAESRAAAANASAAEQQDDIMQELRMLQVQLERTQLDKLRAERSRDGANAKLGRMLMAGVGVGTSHVSGAGSLRAATAASTPVKQQGGAAVGSLGMHGFNHVSASAPVSPLKAANNSSRGGSPASSSSSPHPRAGSSSTHQSQGGDQLSAKVAGPAAGRGQLSPRNSSRVGELQQKDQRYDVHTGSSELL